MTNEPTDKLRALFLTALMVMSVFALTVSFAGTAAAANAIGATSATAFPTPSGASGDVFVEVQFNQSYTDVDNDDFEIFLSNGTQLGVAGGADSDASITAASSGSAWSDSADQSANDGNSVVLTVTTSVPAARFSSVNITDQGSSEGLHSGSYDATAFGNTSITAASTAIYEDTDNDASDGGVATGAENTSAYLGEKIAVVGSTYGEEMEVQDEDGGFYFDGSAGTHSQVHVFDTDGRESNLRYRFLFNGNSTFAGVGDRHVIVRPLDFSISEEETSYTNQDSAIEATITANAGNRPVDVELIYDGNDTVDQTQTITLDSDAESTVSFSNFGLDTEYRVNASDVNTGIEDSTATIETSAVTGSADFSETIFTEERGDIANITVTLDDTTTAEVVLGSSSIGYVQELDITDGDEDGEVTIRWNIYDGTFSVWDSEDKVSVATDATADIIGTVVDAGAPLDTGSYDLNASVGGEEQNVGTVEVIDPSLDGITVRAAPKGAQTRTVTEITENSVVDSKSANQDKFILEVEMSGTFGFFNKNKNYRLNRTGQNNAGSTGAEDEGLYLDIEQTNVGSNAASNMLNASNASLVFDESNNKVYVVVATDATGFKSQIEAGDKYEATMVLNETSPFVKDDNSAVVEKETISGTFTVQERKSEFDNLNSTDWLLVSPEETTVSGTSNVAPGTNLTIKAKSVRGGPYLLSSQDVQVQDDGSWSTSFDFSGRSDTEFDATASGPGSLSDTVSGLVLQPASSSVTINDQDSPNGEIVVVQSVTMSRGGFVAIHSGSASGPIIGSSKKLSAGTHTNVRIALDDPINETTTLVAMPHQDKDDNNEFDAMTDGAYTVNGSAVTDSASVSPSEAQTVTRTVQPKTPTPIIVTKASPTPKPAQVTERTVEKTVVVTKTASPGQPGFGVAIAIVALLAAALLAVRRRD